MRFAGPCCFFRISTSSGDWLLWMRTRSASGDRDVRRPPWPRKIRKLGDCHVVFLEWTSIWTRGGLEQCVFAPRGIVLESGAVCLILRPNSRRLRVRQPFVRRGWTDGRVGQGRGDGRERSSVTLLPSTEEAKRRNILSNKCFVYNNIRWFRR
jgi:hypothetical protein